MSDSVKATKSEGYPVFEGRMNYIDGYDPVSYYAPHSSLQKTSTWLGMGLVLTALAGLGTLVFGFGAQSVGSQEHWATYALIGAVIAGVCIVGGFGLIHYGRRDYRKYRAETGRIN
ncbi:hypothetical protein [Corynebacterium pseudopelargi]|uniref:Uncharacterized protein n=1 Tax=Corynebacterium pseudopelargi TaxID=2080757 RepID=A0A3G6J1X2_9CORY|nr:hypothetical protein [Corynebacterium pseudopelargi]AZA10144.1 hypothetical protein CPPEL_10225 [Corynebacterium pseudopelargi]